MKKPEEEIEEEPEYEDEDVYERPFQYTIDAVILFLFLIVVIPAAFVYLIIELVFK